MNSQTGIPEIFDWNWKGSCVVLLPQAVKYLGTALGDQYVMEEGAFSPASLWGRICTPWPTVWLIRWRDLGVEFRKQNKTILKLNQQRRSGFSTAQIVSFVALVKQCSKCCVLSRLVGKHFNQPCKPATKKVACFSGEADRFTFHRRTYKLDLLKGIFLFSARRENTFTCNVSVNLILSQNPDLFIINQYHLNFVTN